MHLVDMPTRSAAKMNRDSVCVGEFDGQKSISLQISLDKFESFDTWDQFDKTFIFTLWTTTRAINC